MKNFILNFESGIIVIKHWKIHNYLRKDRYKATINIDEASKLHITESGVYTLENVGIPLVHHRLPQSSLGKVIEERDENEIEIMLSEINDEFIIDYINSLGKSINNLDGYFYILKKNIEKREESTLNNILCFY